MERQLRGSPSPPKSVQRARGEAARAAARPPLGAGLGAAQPARALLLRPSSLRPRRTSPSSRSASAAPPRASHSQSRSGSGASCLWSRAAGDTEQPPRGRQGARRTRPPLASATTAEPPPWPAEKPRRKAAGRNSYGTRRRRSFWAGPVAVGVSTGLRGARRPRLAFC